MCIGTTTDGKYWAVATTDDLEKAEHYLKQAAGRWMLVQSPADARLSIMLLNRIFLRAWIVQPN